MCNENNFGIQRKNQRSSMQKEFKNLACDEKLKSEHIGGKKKKLAWDDKPKFQHVGGNENQACDGKQKFKHSKHKI